MWLLKLLLFVVEDATVEDVVSGEQVAGQAGRVDPSVRENRLGFRNPVSPSPLPSRDVGRGRIVCWNGDYNLLPVEWNCL